MRLFCKKIVYYRVPQDLIDVSTEGVKVLQFFLDDVAIHFLGDLAAGMNHPVSIGSHLYQLVIGKVRRDDLMLLKELGYIFI